ncbi:aldo/keto reductase [Microtetraspora glauca]|uniref:Aldo/keto reductase n=1 Tax=Microtetraspora glauca TaxID=1996 RepID=A0ABV3GQZ3_MICGL
MVVAARRNLGRLACRICLGMMSYGDPDKWGGWVLPQDQAEPIVRKAADGGVTFFDTADVYSQGVSEEITDIARGRQDAGRTRKCGTTTITHPLDHRWPSGPPLKTTNGHWR